MDISNLTIEQLKALAYDIISEAEMTQKNLTVINNEIAKKIETERVAMQHKEKEVKEKAENTRGSAEPEKAKEVKPTKEK